ncbi:MAG TPA: DinB family protein [Puia sp.]|nr:DinB family protein [Puia sp.]
MPLSASARTRLEFQHLTIRELIGDRSEQDLRQRTDPAKWSVFENIVHLASYQPLFLVRLERIQKEEAPAFVRYTAEEDPQFPIDLQKPLAPLLDYLDSRRLALRLELESMNENQLLRTGIHPRFGSMTVTQWTEFFLLHEAHHIYTIFRLLFFNFTDH